MSKEMYRQGDLLFVKVDEIPKEREQVRDGVIARGESTGHMHTLRPGNEAMLFNSGGNTYIEACAGGFVDHQEHATIDLPSGNWSIKRQQEYSPDGWNTVAD